MSSPTMGMWECRHGVDGRDHCGECTGYGYDAGPEPDHDPQGMLAEEYQYEENRSWEAYRARYPLGTDTDQDGDNPEDAEDRWTTLLKLIADYGGERFQAGFRAAREPTIKVHAAIPFGDSLDKIIHELLRLQRELGED